MPVFCGEKFHNVIVGIEPRNKFCSFSPYEDPTIILYMTLYNNYGSHCFADKHLGSEGWYG